MQIFSGCVCHLEQLHAQSPFLFPIVFSINLIPFFDICSVDLLAVFQPGCSGMCDSEDRQICTTCLFAESVGLCLCFLPSCAMYKDNAVRNVVVEMGRDLVFMITARLSDLSMPLQGEVRRSPVQSVRQPIARSGKFVRRAYSRRALDCEKDDGLTGKLMYAFSCMLSPIVIVEHTSV